MNFFFCAHQPSSLIRFCCLIHRTILFDFKNGPFEMIFVCLAAIDFTWFGVALLGLAWIMIKFEWFVHDLIEMFFVLTLTMSHRPFLFLSLSLPITLPRLPFHCCDSSHKQKHFMNHSSHQMIFYSTLSPSLRTIESAQNQNRKTKQKRKKKK